MAGAAGLEPTHDGVKVRCLTNLATPHRSGEWRVESGEWRVESDTPSSVALGSKVYTIQYLLSNHTT